MLVQSDSETAPVPGRRCTTLFLLAISALALGCATTPRRHSPTAREQCEEWRAQHRTIDLHQHVNYTTQHLSRAVRIMDRVGVGVAVNLSGGYVTRGTNAVSEFDRNKRLADTLFPGRFLHYMNLDYSGWDEPDFSARAAKQIEEGRRLGAAGFKEYKRLGLYQKDGAGKLIRIDDPKLDAMWKRCGELGMPVSIHVADPRAFWLPYDSSNERWKELKDHKSWWFGDTNKFPPRMELLEALNRVIARHPKTTFVCVHFANNAEELEWVDAALSKYPNMMADLAARIPEIGRHDPEKVRRLFVKHQDRVFFATDFQVYNRLILGSSGNEPPPTDDDAAEFFAKEWRWLETNDRDFPHMTPIQGDWTISGIGLPASVLRKIYFDNARKLLARSLPPPVLHAARVEKDFRPDGDVAKGSWDKASPVQLEYESRSAVARPEFSTTVRALWSEKFLYLAFDCPFTALTVFEPAQKTERFGLWEKDVVEAFIGSDTNDIRRYTEYEISPTNERLDVRIALPKYDFDWSSGFESATRIDQKAKRWTTEVRIALSELGGARPEPGMRWRINLYRCDYANKVFLAFNPVLVGSFHTPERFGVLEFQR
jgi:predicted TIM-barrel fold metal-dependent hydrolase